MTEGEERELLALVASLDYHEIRMHGVVARRTTAHFGVLYGYESRKVEPTEPIPEGLRWLRDRCAVLADLDDPERFVEALITRYPPGAGIGWHRDAPMFGSSVAGVSLGGAARMRFRRDGHETFVLPLEPRSAYVLAGAARWQWRHTIPGGKEERYSITFRTLKEPKLARWVSDIDSYRANFDCAGVAPRLQWLDADGDGRPCPPRQAAGPRRTVSTSSPASPSPSASSVTPGSGPATSSSTSEPAPA